MSNSTLATYFRQSPNFNPRTEKISKVTWHHMAGVSTVEAFGNRIANPAREMSATYCIGSDARVGRFLDETTQRPWTSSSSWNDQRAVTIEISNSSLGGDWPISDAVFNKAIDLTVDICKRNGIKVLTYTGDKNGSLTFHSMYAPTSCPGPYIKARANKICELVNAKLNPPKPIPSTPVTSSTGGNTIKVGSLVTIVGATYYSGAKIPAWVRSQRWYVSSLSGDRAILGKNEKKTQDIQSPINVNGIKLVQKTTATSSTATSIGTAVKAYVVQLRGTDKIYTDGTGKTSKGTIGGAGGAFTIVAENVSSGIKYGKLKSGAGWVKVVNNPTPTVSKTIKVGDTVKVLKNVQYNGKTFALYASTYKVLEVSGDRAVISSDGKNVTAAVNVSNIQKV